MKQLNVFYRAFTDYRAQTTQERALNAQRESIARVNSDSDKIVLTRKICTVKEDWIEAIEQGLVYIEKAIKEERQFIRSNGEVEPIEKIKHVSKDSVEHLARHSNLLTRESEGEDIVPDHLYTVERLSDYAVYENRFLYMLLRYLQDFITLRYDNILELSNTYNGSMTMNKTVKLANRTLLYDVKMQEERRDDKYLRDHNEAREIIERIDLLLKAVVAFLATPLMEFVAKVPMIKPPIVKTNVLKMNNNFKQAMELYSFVTTYEGDGYTVETVVKEMNPFSEDVADQIAETILLSSFLTYEHSLGIEGYLKDIYDKEQQRLKEEEYQRFLERLEAARLKVKKSEMSYEEYITMLETHNRNLQKRCETLDATKQALENTKRLLKAANDNIEELTETLNQTIAELNAEKKRYIDDMTAMQAAHEEAINSLNAAHAEEIESLNAAHTEEINGLNAAHEKEVTELKSAHETYVSELVAAHDQQVAMLISDGDARTQVLIDSHCRELDNINQAHSTELADIKAAYEAQILNLSTQVETLRADIDEQHRDYEGRIETLNSVYKQKLAEKQSMIDKLDQEKQALDDNNVLIAAQMQSMRREQGKDENIDYSTREGFAELERMYEQFTLLYKEQWSMTKEKIRKDLLKPYKKSQKLAKRMERRMKKAKKANK